MEIREQLLTVTEVRNLEHVGFSSEEIASLARGLLELRQKLSTSLAHQRRSSTPYLLAGRFDKLEVKDQRTALIES